LPASFGTARVTRRLAARAAKDSPERAAAVHATLDTVSLAISGQGEQPMTTEALDGKTLRFDFEDGPLKGRDFDHTFHDGRVG
jgi:hypothetical protein